MVGLPREIHLEACIMIYYWLPGDEAVNIIKTTPMSILCVAYYRPAP